MIAVQVITTFQVKPTYFIKNNCLRNEKSENPKNILIIEDDDDVRALLEFFLVREGYAVDFAVDGEQAIRKIQSNNLYSLILLDIMMPYHDGFEILKHIKSNNNWKDVPVIMITALDDEENISRSYELGIRDYLGKPFDPDMVLKKIKHLLESPE